MTKLLRQVYGVWTSNTPFDPQYEAKKKQLVAELQTTAPESPDSPHEKTETSGPKLETHKESACEEVTEVSASLEPVASAPSEVYVAEKAGRPPIDYKVLRDQIPLQQLLEKICRVPIQSPQHRGPCPIHEPTATAGRKFSANLKSQVFRCFDPSCGVQGNVLDLWKIHTKLDLYAAAEDLAKTFGVTIPYLPSSTQKTAKKKTKNPCGHHPPAS